MNYNELKNTVLNKYGHIDDIPDSVYNAMKAYKENGAAALDDDRTYNILKQETSSVQPKQTYQEYAPSLREKVKVVGYSGLSDTDKEIFKSQYPSSQASKTMSFDEVVKYIDSEARKPQDEYYAQPTVADKLKEKVDIGNAYQTVRDVLSIPVGAVTGSVQTGLEKLFGMPYKQNAEGVAIPQEAPSLLENIKEGMRKGSEGEGFSGLAADPLNLTLLVPGLGETVLGAKIGASIPTWGQVTGRGALGAVEGAGYGVGSILLDPTKKDQSISDAVKYGGLLGGIGGMASGFLKRSAIDNFPGVDKIERSKMSGKKNTEMLDISEAERARIYNMLPIIPTRRAYYDAGQELTKSTIPAYKNTDAIFDKALEEHGYPFGGITTDDLERIITAKLDEATTAKSGLLQNMAVEDADKVIADYVSSRMGGIRKTASKTPRKTLTGDEALNVVPISNLGDVLGKLNTDIGRGVGSKIPTTESKMALVAKDAIVSDILGKKVSNIENTDDLLRTLTEGGLAHNGQIKSYNDLLEEFAPGTRENYSLGKRLLGTIAQQAETGPSVRLGVPGLGEVGPHTYLRMKGNYIGPGLSWKAGKLLSKPLAAPTIGIGSSLVDGISSDSTKK